jgi:hypothetical protein
MLPKVYPNPVSDFLMVAFPDFSEKTVEVIDLHGKVYIRKVFTEQLLKIDTPELASGLYIVKTYGRDKVTTQLIIKD